MSDLQKVTVIGAGPAGLTAAYELLKKGGYDVVVFEESDDIGGISRTVNYKGNRMDMGGHRFFSKVPEVNKWWEMMLPRQGERAKDDIILDREVSVSKGGPDPEKADRVMLMRHRVSRILFMDRFFDYPISMKPETFRNLGLINTLKVGFSYLGAAVHKLPETDLENFYVNRFGRKLYSMFFEYYTENLWGRHPSEIDASWGAQRVKGLSISAVIRDIFSRMTHKKDRKVETSLIEEFSYPKYGPGQMWEITASEIERMGGRLIKKACVKRLHLNPDTGRIDEIIYEKDGREITERCDIVISSMPLKDLTAGINGVPEDIAQIASGLPYRDYMTVGVLVRKLKLKNTTQMKTVGDIVPDCWIYVQDRRVKLGRIQIYNNWSPYLVNDLENTVWTGLEYFVQENDEYWNMDDKAFSDLAVDEMVKIGIINSREDVLDSHVERVKKAYPAYFDTYDKIDRLVEYLNTIPNLYCVGRNGQHRYNNIDHSMCTSFEAVKNIVSGAGDKANIWNVNTEQDYHEGET
ncbi:MAG: NAD(P)/FAD-dependent oxidoreductase [Lachnospiraceae bacterium]|nr:NAD(P)/FAD-dependent oxidoreductase [Lachnospiraceae bacterium]